MAPTDHGLPTREAYKAGRDKKLTPGEKAAIEKVKQAAIKGVCARCADKVQWRFQYDKYKPLKQAAACSQCRKKVVKVNYRTLCSECANARGVCEGCCEPKDGKTEAAASGATRKTGPTVPSAGSSSSPGDVPDPARGEP